VLQKIPIPGDGGYDYLYLDDSAKRLYVSHGTEVAVLDATSGAMVGTIAGLAGVHGISVVPGIGKGFITNGKSGMVTVFRSQDAQVPRVRSRAPARTQMPLIYDPASRRLFVFNHSSGQVTVIDPATNVVTPQSTWGGSGVCARRRPRQRMGQRGGQERDRPHRLKEDGDRRRYPLAPVQRADRPGHRHQEQPLVRRLRATT